MQNKTITDLVSVIVIVVMTIGIFSVSSGIGQDHTYAAITDAEASKNAVTVPVKMKYGNSYTISATGDRYELVYKNYLDYLKYSAGNISENEWDNSYDNDIHDYFTTGESFYVPSKMTIKTEGHHPKVIRFMHDRTDLSVYYNTYKYTLPKNFKAGKYTVTTEFIKCSVDIIIHDHSKQDVRFPVDSSGTYETSKTFFVASKVKLNFNSKKGKLAKSKRTLYLDPTKKFGKLPKPKAKKGYKFVGWYSKKKGGQKIKASTKVPTKNTQTLYARYKKK